VEKVVYVLWRDGDTPVAAWSAGLRAAGADALPEAGALGVQVNVADEAVAPALLRMAEIDPQIEAVVSVWVDSARTAARRPLDDAVAAVPGTARVEAYLVTESEPLRNTAHPVAPGERTPGFANLAFLRRPADMPPEAWIAAWHDGHTQERGGPPADAGGAGRRRHRRGAVPDRGADRHARLLRRLRRRRAGPPHGADGREHGPLRRGP
jgi:hypothetical protein